MQEPRIIERVVDLTDPGRNVIYNMTVEDARARVATGDAEQVRGIDGDFALLARKGKIVRLARSIARPLRYFIAKRQDGPCLVAADRIDTIRDFLRAEGLSEQFHPSYTRMAPAHHITEVALLGCPDPSPTYRRFFEPRRDGLPPEIDAIGRAYMESLHDEVVKWLTHRATDGPVGVCFSGGVDSGAVFLITYHAMLELGISPSRLKAFTLSVEGEGNDAVQARRFLEDLGLGLFLETIEVPRREIDWRQAVRVVEDYKELDVQSAAMALALCRGIRRRYPDWRWLADGDGGDENLKDYPIEENPELTIRSVLSNPLLYHEGWGVGSLKHSLTYSGGLSRGVTRTYAPATSVGFEGFSPYTLPSVIRVSEAIPFIELTGWSHARLYDLKGDVVRAGIRAVTGMEMPVFPKRRFQHGTARRATFGELFPGGPAAYRREFQALHG